MKSTRVHKRLRATQDRRHRRSRVRFLGTADRPRLVVFRSLRHISAQIINDRLGRTLVAATDRGMKGPGSKRASGVGTAIAEKAKKEKIQRVVFDRRGYQYHGQVKALADAARAAGLIF
ncbi:MAG: 50S ribosomal protein L18 [bacterium]